MRSNRCANWVLRKKRLPGQTPSHKIFQCWARKNFCFPYQSIDVASVNDRRFVSLPVARGNIFQMDQTASENQKILWHFWKCCQNSNMDCHLNVCSDSDNEKTVKNRFDSLHYFTDFKYIAFWENAHLSGASAKRLQQTNYYQRYPVEFIRKLTGHYWN